MAFSKFATTRQLSLLVRDAVTGTASGFQGDYRLSSLSSLPFSKQSSRFGCPLFSTSTFSTFSSPSLLSSSSSSSSPLFFSPFPLSSSSSSSFSSSSSSSSLLGSWKTSGLTTGARFMATESEGVVAKPKKRVTDITTEAQFRFVCQKVLKSLAEYVQKQDFSTKKLVKILRRMHMLASCRFRDELPAEFVAFTFFLLSQLVQGRATTDRLVDDLMAVYTPLIRERVDQFDAQTVAKVFWGFGDLAVPPEADIMDKLCAQTVQNIHSIEFYDAVNILMSFHKYNDMAPSGNFVDSLTELMISKMEEATPHALARLLTCFHLISVEPSAALVDAIGLQALKAINDFETLQVSSFIYAIGTLDYRPQNINDLFPALTERLTQTGVEDLGPRALSRLLSAMAYLEIPIPEKLVPLFQERITKTTINASPKNISELLVACGMSKLSLPTEVVESFKSQLLSKAQRVKAAVVGHALAGFARLKVPLDETFLQYLHRRGILSVAAAEISDLLALVTGYNEQNFIPTGEEVQEIVWRAIECLAVETGDNIHTFFELYRRCKEYPNVDLSELYNVLKGVTDLDPDNPEAGLQSGDNQNEDEDSMAAKAIEEMNKTPRTPESVEDFYDPPDLYEYIEPDRADNQQPADPPDLPDEEEED